MLAPISPLLIDRLILTWKSREIGGLVQTLRYVDGISWTSAVSKLSELPWKRLNLHMMLELSGSYTALPLPLEKMRTCAVLLGTGILQTTFVPKLLSSKMAFILMLNSILF